MQKPELFLVFIRPLNHLGIPYMITGSTDAIIRKLIYYKEGGSEKHLQDIRNILSHNKEGIARSEIDKRIKEYNLSEGWNLIVKTT